LKRNWLIKIVLRALKDQNWIVQEKDFRLKDQSRNILLNYQDKKVKAPIRSRYLNPPHQAHPLILNEINKNKLLKLTRKGTQ
jgi:hypothetical protein